MAKINKGILGPLSGRVGPVIGFTWKGIPCIKGRTEKQTPPATPAQIESRKKLSFLNNLLVPFHPYITVGFGQVAHQKTEISAAFSRNYHAAVLGTYPDYVVAYDQFVISTGALPMVTDVAVELSNPDTIQLTWKQNSAKHTSFDDQLILVIYCPELRRADGFIGGVKRNAEQCTYVFNPNMIGKRLEIYLGMSSINRKHVAESIYLGSLPQV